MPKLKDNFQTGDEITISCEGKNLRRSANINFSEEYCSITIKRHNYPEWPPGMYIEYPSSLYSIDSVKNCEQKKTRQYISPTDNPNSVKIIFKKKPDISIEDETITVGDDGIGG